MTSTARPNPAQTGAALAASNPSMFAGTPKPSLCLVFASLLAASLPLHAQSQPQAEQTIQAAVQSELAAARDDHSAWMFHDADSGPGKNDYFQVVDTPKGGLRRLIRRNGHPVDQASRDAETNRIAAFVDDPSEQAKQRKAGAHDDAQAEEMTRMLPHAFLWSIASETPEYITLDYRPNPAFDPPGYEARVMSMMAGQVIVARNGNRIRSLHGSLTQDVKFGYGLFGRLKAGGTFDIERRQIAPGIWQITESHVHIGGHALLFKNIGQQDDEVKTDFKPSPAHTLREAEEILRTAQ
jgi:hypothetical protein